MPHKLSVTFSQGPRMSHTHTLFLHLLSMSSLSDCPKKTKMLPIITYNVSKSIKNSPEDYTKCKNIILTMAFRTRGPFRLNPGEFSPLAAYWASPADNPDTEWKQYPWHGMLSPQQTMKMQCTASLTGQKIALINSYFPAQQILWLTMFCSRVTHMQLCNKTG